VPRNAAVFFKVEDDEGGEKEEERGSLNGIVENRDII